MWNRISRIGKRVTGASLAAMFAASMASAVTTKFWSSTTYEDFANGNFSGVSLGREGTMSLAPQMKELFSTDQAVVWAVARDQHGNTYLGTGHGGKVFKLGPDMKGSVFFEAPESDIFALAVDKENRLYVGTSPDGKVYKVEPSGKSEEFFDPQAKYIWAMSFSPTGELYVGTGDRGKIFRVRPNGTGELFYDTHQSHVMSLASAANGDLIAGSEPNGLLYRLSSAGKAFVLYDAPLSEVHSLAIGSDGSIYASALGGTDDQRLRPAQRQNTTADTPVQATTTITVRAAQGPGISPGDSGDTSGVQRTPDSGAADTTTTVTGVATARADSSGGLKSTLFRVLPDGTVETLWNSQRESAFDLLPQGDRILFSTDEKGRIYELTPDHRVSLVTETDQEETTRLLPIPNYVLAATANLGKIYQVGTRPADSGYYESEVRDTGGIASWGKIRWLAETPAGAGVELFTRSGNSARPDATWSDWSAPYRRQGGEQIASPSARYIQWKVAFHSADSHSPVLHEVTVPYMQKNQAPTVTDLKVVSRGERALAGAQSGGAASAIGATPRAPGYAASMHAAGPKGFDISWQGSDPDQDDLTYNLYFRGEGESEWKLLQGDLKQNYFQLDNDALPDGQYRLRVVASDGAVNPAGMAKTAEVVSGQFSVDNAPPRVESLETKRAGGSATVRFRGADVTSALTRAEYVLDGEQPVPVLSDDGIIDSQEETFTIVLDRIDGREHLLTLRVFDAAGNMGVGKALLSAPAAGGGK